MYFETDEAIFETSFSQVQIEITGKCNMKCAHCRDSFDRKADMPASTIRDILSFVKENGGPETEIVLSGGEPFLHKDMRGVLQAVIDKGFTKLYVTTNGSRDISPFIDLLEQLDSTISVSLDSMDARTHDTFRKTEGAFAKACETINYLTTRDVLASVRMSVTPDMIDHLDEMAKFVFGLGAKRFAVSSILPCGDALKDPSLFMTTVQKRAFLAKVFELRERYYPQGLKVATNDPLQNLTKRDLACKDASPTKAQCSGCKHTSTCFPGSTEDTFVIDGCTAAITSFNVFANGDVTPCAMMNEKIFNVFETPAERFEKAYSESELVQALVARKFNGKCASCDMRHACGGCRVRALAESGDILGEDPDCWR